MIRFVGDDFDCCSCGDAVILTNMLKNLLQPIHYILKDDIFDNNKKIQMINKKFYDFTKIMRKSLLVILKFNDAFATKIYLSELLKDKMYNHIVFINIFAFMSRCVVENECTQIVENILSQYQKIDFDKKIDDEINGRIDYLRNRFVLNINRSSYDNANTITQYYLDCRKYQKYNVKTFDRYDSNYAYVPYHRLIGFDNFDTTVNYILNSDNLSQDGCKNIFNFVEEQNLLHKLKNKNFRKHFDTVINVLFDYMMWIYEYDYERDLHKMGRLIKVLEFELDEVIQVFDNVEEIKIILYYIKPKYGRLINLFSARIDKKILKYILKTYGNDMIKYLSDEYGRKCEHKTVLRATAEDIQLYASTKDYSKLIQALSLIKNNYLK